MPKKIWDIINSLQDRLKMSDISLKLWSKNAGELFLRLNEIPPNWRKEEISEYALEAETEYEFDLYPTDNIQSATLYANDSEIGYFSCRYDKLEFSASKKDDKSKFLPFLTYFGYIIFKVEISYCDGKSDILYTKYIDVTSRSAQTNDQARTLLNEIERYSDSIFGDWVFNKVTDNDENDVKYSWWYGSLHSKSSRYMDAYIELLKDVLDKYRQNFSFFKVNAYHKIEYHQKVISYDKLRRCSRNDFQWLMQNTEHFAPLDVNMGIKYQNKYYMPSNILGDEQYKNFDVYENQIIICFLYMILKNCDFMCKELSQSIENMRELIKKHINVRDYYSISLLTLKSSVKSEWVEQLDSLRREFQLLWSQYSKIWPIKQSQSLTKMPYITKIFQEVRYYRDIYEAIRRWFEFGEFSLVRLNAMLKIKTIDVLYEYYCLYKILEMLTVEGWYPVKQNDNFSYFFSYERYKTENEICNTYYFQKDDKIITLYYQPKIFGWDTTENNHINLFRTTKDINGKQSFWMPDFLLKVQTKEDETYMILDAKYATATNIQNSLLPECISKYINQISGKNKYSAVKLMILLQGKTTDEYNFTNYQNSEMSGKYYNGPIIGTIPFGSQSKTNNLYKVISDAMKS